MYCDGAVLKLDAAEVTSPLLPDGGSVKTSAHSRRMVEMLKSGRSLSVRCRPWTQVLQGYYEEDIHVYVVPEKGGVTLPFISIL